MGKRVHAKEFVYEAFDYRTTLETVHIDRSANVELIEYIAYGFAKYGDTPEAFEKHVDEWCRSLCKIYPELGYDHKAHQIKAVIDLVDQLVIVDNQLVDQLRYVIDILRKYGLLVKYTDKNGDKKQTTLLHFFENIERQYPVIKARYKGLGSSSAEVSREVVMDPRTRRLIRVNIDDPTTWATMSKLVGDGKENKKARKEMLMNFKFTMDMIDN